MALTADGPAPYGPPGAVTDIIERFRRRGLQAPLTPDVLARAGISESLTRRVLWALKQLDFVDADGNPSAVLEKYAKAPNDEARAVLEKAVRDAYEPVFRYVNPAEDPPDRIRDAFRSYEPRAQQDRMVTLFVGLCRYAGIMPEPAKRAADVVAQVAGKAVYIETKRRRPSAPPRVARGRQAQVPAAKVPDELPAAVQGLLRELAVIGPSWTRERRDQFMQVWCAVIDFSFPVQDDEDGTELVQASPGESSHPTRVR